MGVQFRKLHFPSSERSFNVFRWPRLNFALCNVESKDLDKGPRWNWGLFVVFGSCVFVNRWNYLYMGVNFPVFIVGSKHNFRI